MMDSCMTCPYCNKPVDQYDSIKVGNDRFHYQCGDKIISEWKQMKDEGKYVPDSEEGVIE